MGIEAEINVEIDRQLPDAENDGDTKQLRGGRYGEAYMLSVGGNQFHLMADEGTYKVAMSTPGSGITAAINTGISETAGNFLHLKNNDANDNVRAKRIYPHYLRLICTTLPAAATSVHCFFKLDNTNRYTSGGTQLTVQNPNIGSGQGTTAQVFAGALTTGAPSQSAYPIGRAIMRSAIPILNDEWLFTFGHVDGGAGLATGGAAAQRMIIPMPPIALSPQTNLSMQLWIPANAVTAGVFEVEFGFFER